MQIETIVDSSILMKGTFESAMTGVFIDREARQVVILDQCDRGLLITIPWIPLEEVILDAMRKSAAREIGNV